MTGKGHLVYHKWGVVSMVVFYFCLNAGICVGEEIRDPIFRLYYNTDEIHFDLIESRSLEIACGKLVSIYAFDGKLPEYLTLYARYETDFGRLYIVGRGDEEDLYVIRPEGCKSNVPMIGLLRRRSKLPLPTEMPLISDIEAAGLFRNAILRYEAAFGGRAPFLNWLDSRTDAALAACGNSGPSCPETYHLYSQNLLAILHSYREMMDGNKKLSPSETR